MSEIIKPKILPATLLLCVFSFFGGARAAQIAVNSIGFFPVANKVATVRGTASSFELAHAFTGETVFSGSTVTDWDAEESIDVKLLDFSAFETRGTYFLRTDTGDTSATFRIREGVYNDSYKLAMKGLYLMRCGCAVSYEHEGVFFEHGPCHLHDADMRYSGIVDTDLGTIYTNTDGVVEGTICTNDLTGGWHDAGDYNKYTVNGAFSLGVLFKAWDTHQERIETMDLGIPGEDPAVPDFLEECKWQMDWLLKLQQPDGMLLNIVANTSHDGIKNAPTPDNDFRIRYVSPTATMATGYGCAAMAMAARIFEPYLPAYATTCSNAAVAAWNSIYGQPDIRPVKANIILKYNGTSYQENNARLWAAAEIYELTGLAQAKNYFDAHWNTNGNFERFIAWGGAKHIGRLTYLTSKRQRSDTVIPKLKKSLNDQREDHVSASMNNPYDQGWSKYTWGYNGTFASISMMFTAHRLTYEWEDGLTGREHSRKLLDYLMGRNRYARSFVTGMGHNPPLLPHDRRSSVDVKVVTDAIKGAERDIESGLEPRPIPPYRAPWPGALVGGERYAGGWSDSQGSYYSNEISINGQACLIHTFAGTVDTNATPNTAPEIISAAPTIIIADTTFLYTVEISDSNTNDVLAIVGDPLPGWMQVGTSHTLVGTPSVAHIGNNNFALVVTDGFTTTTQQVALSVVPGFPDIDGDGMDDHWETNYFGNITISDGTIDSDGDGHDDFGEFKAGSIPNDDTSQLKLTDIKVRSNAMIQLRWLSSTNRTYSVSGTENLQGGFTNPAMEMIHIFATPPTNTWIYDAPSDAGNYFYRIILE